jgi:hypothetical protein
MADQTTGPDQTGARAHRPAGHRTAPADQTTRTSRTGLRPTTSVQAAADQPGRPDQTTEVAR